VEPLGSEVIVELGAGDHTFVGRLDPTTTARPMHEMAVYFDMGRFHLFDAETGASLARQ
jgi:multiple sugar transport system ATP-binding protein